MANSLASYIDAQVANLKPRYTRIAELQWQSSTTGDPQVDAQLSAATQEVRHMLAEPERYAELRRLMDQAPAQADGRVARQAVLLSNTLREHQIPADLIARITALEVEIQARHVRFRAVVDGRSVSDNDLRHVLRTSSDAAARKAAWEASKRIGVEVAELLRELARLRNQAARQAGFDNFYTMRLELDELDEGELFALLDQLKRGLDPAWRSYKAGLDAQLARRFGIAADELRPWHYADPFFQEGQPNEVDLDRYFADKDPVALSRAYFGAIGMDVDDILARSDLYEREGKEQSAFCTHIDREGDVRILCNNRPDARWTETTLHELGHAVYDKYIDRDLPWLLRAPAHTLTTEAIALLSGGLVREAAWLARYAGVAPEEAARLAGALRESARVEALTFARWVFVMCHFERALYRDPEQDLNAAWWECIAAFQGLIRPEGRDTLEVADWAAKIHLGIAPVYYHNYLLGAMMAAQLRDHMLSGVAHGSEDAYVADPAIGVYLIERAFKPGSIRDWRGWLRHATGQDLSAEAYIRRLSGE